MIFDMSKHAAPSRYLWANELWMISMSQAVEQREWVLWLHDSFSHGSPLGFS